MTDRHWRATAVAIAFVTAWWSVITVKGGFSASPSISLTILLLLAIASVLPRVRRIASGAAVVAVAAFLVLSYYAAIAYDYSSIPLLKGLDLEWFVWSSVFVISLVLEMSLPARFAAHTHPASAVAAAAFMIVPTLGVDVTTGYHDRTPSWAAALAAAFAPLLEWTPLPAAAKAAVRLIEPLAVVTIGWAVAFSSHGDVHVGEWPFFLRWIGSAAVAAALLGIGKLFFVRSGCLRYHHSR